MKARLLIISLIYVIFLINNANSVGERGQEPKLYKSFDEIFGKGWDAEVLEFTETKEWHKNETQTTEVENKSTDQPNPNEQSFSDHFESFVNRKIRERFDEIYDENWSEDENNSAPSADDIDQENSNKHLSDQNNSTDQDESVDEQQNESNKSEKIKTDQQKREILKQFYEIKSKCQKAKLKNISMRELDDKIAKELFVSSATIYVWKRKFGLSVNNKKFSDFEKRKILKHFDEIKSKCKKAKFKNILMNELDEKIAKKLGVCRKTIYDWKHKFGLTVSNNISDKTKIGILNKYAEMKGNNPKMTDATIAEMLKISLASLYKWKKQFNEGKKHF